MKKILKSVAIAIVAVNCVVLVSCKKKSHDTTPSTPSNTSSATVSNGTSSSSGTSYSATNQVILPNDSATAVKDFSQGKYPTVPSSGGYISMMGSYPLGTVGGQTISAQVYGYVFAQIAVLSPGDTATWGFTIASLGAPVSVRTYTLAPSLTDSAQAQAYYNSLLSGSGTGAAAIPATATGFYDDSKGLFQDSTSTGSVTISSINTADSTISGSYSLTVIGKKGSVPPSVTISNAQFSNIHYQNFKTTK